MVSSFDASKRLMAPLLRFLFLNLCWIAFLFSLIRVCNSQASTTDDGGLQGKYDKNVASADEQVTLFWTLSTDTISIAAQGAKKSGYLAIGFGTQMVNTYAYVGWLDDSGKGKLSTYWIDAKSPSGIHPTKENLTNVSVNSENGIISFEFTRVLNPSCNRDERIECGNIIDPGTPLNVVWAMGDTWSNDQLSKANFHSSFSSKSTSVMLPQGTAKAEKSIPLLVIAHGVLMFLGWGVILPTGIICARYLKHLNGDKWFRLHIYLQYSGLALVVIAFICIVLLLQGLVFDTLHVIFGFVAILLGILQPVNALFRPKKPESWEDKSTMRVLWEYIHVIGGRCAIMVAVAALITGLRLLGEQYGKPLTYAFVCWICVGVITVICKEIRGRKTKNRSVSIKQMGEPQYVEDEYKIAIK